MVLVSCEKSEYDWTKVEPGKQIIEGPDSVSADNQTIYQYLAISRGGSTYVWNTLEGYPKAAITNDTKYPFMANITFNSNKDTVVALTVSETTHGGKTGVADTFFVKLIGYCELDINNFIGSRIYKENDYAPYTVSLSQVKGDTIQTNNFFHMGWRLKYYLVKGISLEVKILPELYYYEGEKVTVKGGGTYNSCKGSMKVDFAVVRLNGDTIPNGSGTHYYYKGN